jgi:predicted acylesterase/phospholipase RssA
MFLASIRANNRKFIRVLGARLVADLDFPTRESDMLITNLSHPNSLRITHGDALLIRSCATNGVWGARQARVLQPNRLQPPALFLNEELLRAPWDMDARWPISRAVGTVKQCVQALIPSAGAPHPNINTPIVVTLNLSLPILWNPPVAAAPSMVGGSIRTAGVGMVPGSATATPAAAAIPDAAEILETAFPAQRHVLTPEIRVDAEGRLEVRGRGTGPAGPIANWFYLTPHMIRARFRLADGRFLNQPGGGAFPLSSSKTPSQTAEFTVVRLAEGELTDSFGYRLFHQNRVYMRSASGQLLCTDRPANPTRLVGAPTIDSTPVAFQFERAAGQGEIGDGDFITIVIAGTNRRIKVNADSTVGLTTGTDATRFAFDLTKEFHLYRNPTTNEFASLAEPATSLPAGFAKLRSLGRLYIGPRPETAPVRSFRASPTEFYTSALAQGSEYAHQKGFSFRSVEGYAHLRMDVNTHPTKLYWQDGKTHGFLAASKADEEAALAAGYRFNWIDGHLLPSREVVAVTTVTHTATLAPRGGMPTLPPGTSVTPAVPGIPGVAAGTVIPGVTMAPRPVRALVLSGGGAKGCFEVGAVKYLWSQGWRPDIICGVSVGAVNAVKLAENADDTVDELITQWRTFSSTPNRIFYRNLYVDFISAMVDRLAGKAGDAGIGAAIGYFLGGGLPGAVAGLFAGKEASQLDRGLVRLINITLNLFHSLHCMQPLRNLLATQIRPERLAASGVRLRLGITDVQSGQFFTVSGPDAALGPALANYGLLEAEPDHALGGSWLTHPVLGADRYAMRLDHAVYASSTLPVFMDPLVVQLQRTRTVAAGGSSIAVLETDLVQELANLIGLLRRYTPGSYDLLEPHLDAILARFPELNSTYVNAHERHDADQDCGTRGNTRLLFDGGLRDTMPIRTALRMGATEIVAITGDRIQQATFARPSTASLDSTYAKGILSLLNGKMFNGVGEQSVTPFTYLLSLLNIWLNEASRSDMLLSWAGNELVGWMRRASDKMSPEQSRQFQAEFITYWAKQGRDVFEALGASGFMGGRPGSSPYGNPWTSQAAKITYIAPDRDYIDALDFDDGTSVDDGIRLGYEAARNAVTISDPRV